MESERIAEFTEFIYKRQLIWKTRFVDKSDYPWTDDPILRKYKFCNVYRENDKGTKHLIDKVINTTFPLEFKVFNIILYRRFNVDGFFGNIMPYALHPASFDFIKIERIFDSAKAEGKKLFNDAYVLCQRTFESSYREREKHIQILLAMYRLAKNMDIFIENFKYPRTWEDMHNSLKTLPLIGDFLAYQILVDISYCSEFNHLEWDFVSVGPGAVGGIDYMYGKTKMPYDDICKELCNMQPKLFAYLLHKTNNDWENIAFDTPYHHNISLSLPNIQNCLCEFRKYINLRDNPKARKRYYKWTTTNEEPSLL